MELAYVLGNYHDLYKYHQVYTNLLTWQISLCDWNTSFKNCCNFYPSNFKFCAVKKNYKYLRRYCTEIWWKTKAQNEKNKLNIDFLNNCKHLGKYRKLLIFELKNVSDKDAVSIRRRLLRRSINKRNKEFQHLWKQLSLSQNFFSHAAFYYRLLHPNKIYNLW